MSDPYRCHRVTMRPVQDEWYRDAKDGLERQKCGGRRGCSNSIPTWRRICDECYSECGVDGKAPPKE